MRVRNFFVKWIALLPFVCWGSVYEGAKVFWFWLGSLVLAGFWLVNRKKLASLIEQADFWYFAWLLSLAVASILGVHPLDSIVGGSYRHQGVIFFVGLWLVGKTIQTLLPKEKFFLQRALIVGLFVESLIVLVQVLAQKGLVNGRPMGTFGEPNAVGGFLAIGTVFAGSNFLFLAIIFGAILLTASRTALLAFLAALFIRKFIQRKYWLVFLIIGILSLLVFQKAFVGRGVSKFEDRRVIWTLGLKAVAARPFLGYGAESGEKAYDLAFKNAGMPLENFMVDRAHNLILDLTLWSGIPGLVFFSLWLSKKAQSTIIPWLIFALLQPLGIVHWILLLLLIGSFFSRAQSDI